MYSTKLQPLIPPTTFLLQPDGHTSLSSIVPCLQTLPSPLAPCPEDRRAAAPIRPPSALPCLHRPPSRAEEPPSPCPSSALDARSCRATFARSCRAAAARRSGRRRAVVRRSGRRRDARHPCLNRPPSVHPRSCRPRSWRHPQPQPLVTSLFSNYVLCICRLACQMC